MKSEAGRGRSKRAGNWGERAWLAGVCALIGWFYGWTARPEGVSWNFGQRQTDYYNLLVDGFLDGHLYMKVEVPEALLTLADPYNPATRPPGIALHDASMYRGRYYIYFGAGPVVTLLLPFRVLAGGVALPLPAAVLVFTYAGFLVSAGILLGMRRRYFPEAGSGMVMMWVVALGTALGAVVASMRVRLEHAIGVLPLGIAMGLLVVLMNFISNVWVAAPFLILLGALGGFLVVPMNALLQHRGHNLMGAGRSIAVQNFNEQACILLLGGLYSLSTSMGVSAFGAISVFGLLVAGCMALIRRWHQRNCQEHGPEVQRLLEIARNDHLHG